MPRIPVPAWRRLRLVLVMLLGLGALFPTVVVAESHIEVGGRALVANGDPLLRAAPGYEAAVTMAVAAGTTVSILEGPIAATDGSLWYNVAVAGEEGFLPGGFLTAANNPDEATDPAAPDVSATEDVAGLEAPVAAAAVGETATVTTALNLRAGPSTADRVLLVMPAGATVTLTGNSSNGFLSVTYNGMAGWAFADYLSTGGAQPPPTTDGGGTTGTATVTVALNLRTGPSTATAVILVMPAGASVTLIGGSQDGFRAVSYQDREGWAYAEFLATGGAPPAGDGPVPPPSSPTGTATVTTALNLRTGPSTGTAVILVMPAGATVTLTGSSQNGFRSVSYQGTSGWAYAEFLSTDGVPPGDDGPPPAEGPTGNATTTAALNLRASPSTGAAILAVMPEGASVETTGAPQNGFYPVRYGGQSGWAYGAYLSVGGAPGGDPGGGNPGGGGTGIIWPFSGGPWSVIQGYNVGTHTNRGAFAQYAYSLDLALASGSTADQAVVAPVSGTIRWVDRGSGAMLIDAGNGYGVSIFHVTVAGGLSSGQRVQRGQYIGTISGVGGDGYAATPHIQLTVWQFTGGGHVAVPFTGPNAISGREFPSNGSANQYLGTRVSP